MWARLERFFLVTTLMLVNASCVEFFKTEEEPAITSTFRPSKILGAPPVFPHPHLPGDIVPMDIRRSTVDLQIDLNERAFNGSIKLWFEIVEGGYPYFDFGGEISGLKLNGQDVSEAEIRTYFDPTSTTKLRVINRRLRPQTSYTLQANFKPADEHQPINESGTDVFFAFDENSAEFGRGYLGRYIPANLEFDQYPLDLRVTVGNRCEGCDIFTNGQLRRMNQQSWRISFPEYFNSGSVYFHLSSQEFVRRDFSLPGIRTKIKTTVYGTDKETVKRTEKTLREKLSHFQTILGGFPHKRLIVRATGNRHPGSVYGGAVVGPPDDFSIGLLRNWLSHYLLPASGNDRWIGIAGAHWLAREPAHSPTTSDSGLQRASPFNRLTPSAAYSDGPQVMDELNDMLGGEDALNGILGRFVTLGGGLVVTTDDFRRILAQASSDEEMLDFFCERVYARGHKDCD